jgi:predicted patatin/cPLA2 family phospholipase
MKGIVLEGGAYRGLFTAGIIDVMMENGIKPDGMIGVSAGAAFGCNYKSNQPGRAIRYNMRFAHDSRYSGLWSLLTTGNYFNAKFAYHTMPEVYDLFDKKTFNANPMAFYVVCTDVTSGRAVYHQLDEAIPTAYDWIRASASMPIVSRVVELEGWKLLDGGVADSIPLEYFEHLGYSRNVVILTQPQGYIKQRSRLMPLFKLMLRRYPNMVEALNTRHLMYNSQLQYVAEAEQQGRCLVIRPNEPLQIGHVSHDPKAMRRVYDIGRQTAMQYLSQLTVFFE